MSKKKDRTWCFTLFSEGTTKCSASAFTLTPKIRYLVWQLEKCDETGKEHFQGYAEFATPMRLNAVKKLLGYDKVHLEARLGTRDEARAYCMKTDTRLDGPFELGEWSSGGQGKRVDLTAAAKIIREEGIHALADAMPGTFILRQRMFREYQNYWDLRNSSTSREVVSFWISGPSDIGKSHLVYTSCDNLFAITPGTGQLWYDGYNKEKFLLIDDLMLNTIPACDMIHIADKWRYRCPVKGGFVNACWNVVLVTCNHSIEFIYAGTENVPSLQRRFKVLDVRTREECVEAADYIKRCLDEQIVPPMPWKKREAILGLGRGVLGNTDQDTGKLVPPDSPPPNFLYLKKFN